MEIQKMELVKEIFFKLVEISHPNTLSKGSSDNYVIDHKTLDELFHWSYKSVKNAGNNAVTDPASDN